MVADADEVIAITVRLPRDIHRDLRRISFVTYDHTVSINGLINEAIREWLDAHQDLI